MRGPWPLHGFIQLIQAPLNRLTNRGANPVVMDEEKNSYFKAYKWLARSHASGEIVDYHLDGFRHFRAIDVTLTAFAYARAWEKAVRDNEDFRAELTAKHRQISGGKPERIL